jgi:hypothetical protein
MLCNLQSNQSFKYIVLFFICIRWMILSLTLFYLQPIFLCYQVKLDFNIFYELLGHSGLVIVLNVHVFTLLFLSNISKNHCT